MTGRDRRRCCLSGQSTWSRRQWWLNFTRRQSSGYGLSAHDRVRTLPLGELQSCEPLGLLLGLVMGDGLPTAQVCGFDAPPFHSSSLAPCSLFIGRACRRRSLLLSGLSRSLVPQTDGSRDPLLLEGLLFHLLLRCLR